MTRFASNPLLTGLVVAAALAVPTAWRIAPNGRWMVYTSEGYLCW